MKQNLLGVDEAVRREVEEVTGYAIPDPNKPEFNRFVEALKQSHPLLAQKLASALIPTVTSPYEEAAQQAKRRRSIGRLIRNFFYTEDWGEFKLNRRAIMIALLTLITTALATSYVVSNGINERNAKRQALVEQERIARENAAPIDNPEYNTELDESQASAAVSVEDETALSTIDTPVRENNLENTEDLTTETSQSESYYSYTPPSDFAYVDSETTDYDPLRDPFFEPVYDESLENNLATATNELSDENDIPPPSLDGQTVVSIPPPNMFTPFDQQDVADNNVIATSASISSYTQKDNSSEFASFEGNNSLSNFQRDTSTLRSQSPMSTNAQVKENVRVTAFNREETSTSQAISGYKNEGITQNPISSTTQVRETARVTAFSREQTGREQTMSSYRNETSNQSPMSTNADIKEGGAVTSFNREQAETSQALFTREQAATQLSTYTSQSSIQSPMSTNAEVKEQAGVIAFSREQAEPNQALFAREATVTAESLSSYKTETSSLRSQSPMSTNAELQEGTGVTNFTREQATPGQSLSIQNNGTSERQSLTNFTRASTDTAAQSESHNLMSYQRDDTTQSLTLHNNTSTKALGTDVLYKRDTENSDSASGDILFKRDTESDASVSGDVLFRRESSGVTDDSNVSGDVLFNRNDTTSTSSLSVENKEESPIQTGMLYPATLITNAVAIDGGEANFVIAESKAWCDSADCPVIRWVGQTNYKAGRISITFNDIVIDNKSVQGQGVAFSTDNSQDLVATVSDSSPTLAADMLRSVAGGVSDFASALANPTSVTTNGQFAIEQYEAPSIWGYLMGSASDTLKLPDNNDTNIIRTAFSEKGTELYILYQTSDNDIGFSINR